jgi:GNAT superfamily N-acetyltransferase
MANPFIQIQQAIADDFLDVQTCAQMAYSKYIEMIGQEPAPMVADFASQIDSDQVCIARCKGVFAGFVVFYPKEDFLHLENVAVMPSYLGKGIGKKLIEYVEQTARDKCLNAVELYTNEAMIDNLLIYPKLGYVEIGRKQQDGFNRIFFRKAF